MQVAEETIDIILVDIFKTNIYQFKLVFHRGWY